MWPLQEEAFKNFLFYENDSHGTSRFLDSWHHTQCQLVDPVRDRQELPVYWSGSFGHYRACRFQGSRADNHCATYELDDKHAAGIS